MDELTRDTHQRKDLYIGQKRWTPYGNAVFELNGIIMGSATSFFGICK